MKQLYLITFLLIIITALFPCCSDDDNTVDLKDEQIQALAKSWHIQSITLDGTDITFPAFEGFVLTFQSDNTYTTINGSPIFSGNGFWDFDGENLNTLIIDGVGVNITLNNTLILEFNLNGTPIGGRLESLTGDYVIIME